MDTQCRVTYLSLAGVMENSPGRQHLSQNLKGEEERLASRRDKADGKGRDRYLSKGNTRRQQENGQHRVLASAEGSTDCRTGRSGMN